MFELITDVPEAIADFYTVETRTEPTGEQIETEYTYLGEDGNELTGTRMVAEMVDNDYVVQLSKPQSISFDKVAQIIEKHGGKRDDVVLKFISLAIETNKFNFLDTYLAWLDSCKEVNLYNATEQFDDEGEPIDFEQKELPVEPVQFVTTTEQWKVDNYAQLRKAAYGSTVEQLEMQVDGLWVEHIADIKSRYPK